MYCLEATTGAVGGRSIKGERKMRKIKARCGIGFVGENYEEEFEFEDDMSDENIEKEIYEWAQQFLEVCWEGE